MEFYHHNLIIELDDAWWTEAGMENFAPKRKTYRVDKEKAEGKEIFEIRIDEISPVKRNPGVNIFPNDCINTGRTARTRVMAILRWFIDDEAIEPVKVVPESSDSEFRYKLTDGVHRLYCSLAAGFTHVPTIKGFDWETLDQ